MQSVLGIVSHIKASRQLQPAAQLQKHAAVNAAARLKEVSTRHVDENRRQDTAKQKRSKHRLDENRILDLSQRRLLDPDLAIKDLSHNIALLVLDNPWLILVRFSSPSGIHRCLLTLGLWVLKQLPWAEVAVVHAVEDDTHALVSSNQSGSTKDPEESCNSAETTLLLGKGEEDRDEETGEDEEEAEGTSEDDTSAVAVADSPADEVWMRLAAKGGLDGAVDVAEGGWMGGVLKSFQEDDAFT